MDFNPKAEAKRALQPILERIRQEPPEEAFRLAHEMNQAMLDAQADTGTIRRVAVRTMRASGMTLRECAETLGVTIARIAQIEKGMGRRERAGGYDA